MKIRLLKPARINFNAGDVVEASPEQASFLFGVGGAEPVEEKQENKTMEKAVAEPVAEIPEAKKQVVKPVVNKKGRAVKK